MNKVQQIAFRLNPNQWEVLRYLGVYGQTPVTLLHKACNASDEDLVGLSDEEDFIYELDQSTGKYAGTITRRRLAATRHAGTTMIVAISDGGDYVETGLTILRAVLAHLLNHRDGMSVAALLAAADANHEHLIHLDYHGLIETRRAGDTRPCRATPLALRQPGEQRDQLVVRITTRGRTYTDPWM